MPKRSQTDHTIFDLHGAWYLSASNAVGLIVVPMIALKAFATPKTSSIQGVMKHILHH